MYVQNTDNINEVEVIQMLRGKIPEFSGMILRRNKNPAAIFDFDGYFNGDLVLSLDVKVLDSNYLKYDTNIVSVDKVEYMKSNPGRMYYMVYYYPGSRYIRIYNLADVDLFPREITIFHKRAKQYKKCTVYSVSIRQFTHEFYLVDN